MIWLVEHGVGGYDYALYEVFSNEDAAKKFVEAYMGPSALSHPSGRGGSAPTIRPVPLLDEPLPMPYDYRDYRPLFWGDR